MIFNLADWLTLTYTFYWMNFNLYAGWFLTKLNFVLDDF